MLGHGSDTAREEIVARDPRMAARVAAAGSLPAEALSAHISACDVMLQPYPDGVSSRRTSAMVAFAHGVPIVTTAGPLTETIWHEADAAAIVPAGDADRLADAVAALLQDPDRRAAIAGRAARIYDEHFDLRHTIAALRSPA
jgi:glycosyltransferase involved in cell wall biosynthesis